MTVTVTWYLILAAGLFSIGVGGVLVRRNALVMFMSIELMLNAVNINLIAAASHLEGAGSFARFDGQLIAIFIITVAAAEAAIGLGLIIVLFRNKKGVYVDQINELKG